MRPELSLQIPVKDGGEDFGRCLASLRGQRTEGRPWELVIIDDGSAVPVLEQFEIAFPDTVTVNVLRLEDGGNRPAARNAGWRACSAPVSMLSDGDILFPPDIVLRHIMAHRDGRGDVVMGARVNGWMKDATPWQKWFDSRGMGGSPSGPFPPRYFVTGNLSIRTDLLRDTGGFDTAIDRYGGEDTELGLRLSRLEPVMFWDPELRVYHLDRVTVREHSRKMVEYGGSGLKYTLKKHPEAEGMLGSHWVKPLLAGPPGPGTAAMRLLVRIALRPEVYRSVLRWMEKFGAPSFLFTFLSVGGCLMGLEGKSFEQR